MHSIDLGDRYFIITADHHLSPEFSQILYKVVSERVVVIENENHTLSGSQKVCRLAATNFSLRLFAVAPGNTVSNFPARLRLARRAALNSSHHHRIFSRCTVE